VLSTLSAAQRLSVFQQVCSALAHGRLAARYVLVASAQDNAIEAKVFKFIKSVMHVEEAELNRVVRGDSVDLGYLGVRLLAGCDKEQEPFPSRRD
jgi:hypothetical protein